LGKFPRKLKPLIRRFGPEAFIRTAKSNARNAEGIFCAVIALGDQIRSAEDLDRYIRALIDIASASQFDANLVLRVDVPQLTDLIAGYGIESFVAIAQAGRGSGRLLQELAGLKDLVANCGILGSGVKTRLQG